MTSLKTIAAISLVLLILAAVLVGKHLVDTDCLAHPSTDLLDVLR